MKLPPLRGYENVLALTGLVYDATRETFGDIRGFEMPQIPIIDPPHLMEPLKCGTSAEVYATTDPNIVFSSINLDTLNLPPKTIAYLLGRRMWAAADVSTVGVLSSPLGVTTYTSDILGVENHNIGFTYERAYSSVYARYLEDVRGSDDPLATKKFMISYIIPMLDSWVTLSEAGLHNTDMKAPNCLVMCDGSFEIGDSESLIMSWDLQEQFGKIGARLNHTGRFPIHTPSLSPDPVLMFGKYGLTYNTESTQAALIIANLFFYLHGGFDSHDINSLAAYREMASHLSRERLEFIREDHSMVAGEILDIPDLDGLIKEAMVGGFMQLRDFRNDLAELLGVDD